jgi:hypothetical protein
MLKICFEALVLLRNISILSRMMEVVLARSELSNGN